MYSIVVLKSVDDCAGKGGDKVCLTKASITTDRWGGKSLELLPIQAILLLQIVMLVLFFVKKKTKI